MAAAVTVTVTPLLSGMAHFLIGLSSWLMVSVLYVQLPRFSYSEYDDSHSGSNNIYATINLYIQASNALGILTGIGMASQYVTGLSLSLSGLGRWVSCKRIITLSVPLLGVVASIVLATNDVVTTQKKNGSSTILYALAFAAGVVGSASMSTIFAHALDAGKARPHVMRADVRAVLTSAGAGACGLVAQIFAYAQGMSRPDDVPLRISSKDIFVPVAAIQSAALLAFVLVPTTAAVGNEYFEPVPAEEEDGDDNDDVNVEEEEEEEEEERLPRRRLQMNTVLAQVFLSSVLEFFAPAIIPKLVHGSGTNHSSSLWAITAAWNAAGILGRVAIGVLGRRTRERHATTFVALAIQTAAWLFAVVCATKTWVAVHELSTPVTAALAMAIGSMMHGAIVTAAWTEAKSMSAASSIGVANQVGAAAGAIFGWIGM